REWGPRGLCGGQSPRGAVDAQTTALPACRHIAVPLDCEWTLEGAGSPIGRLAWRVCAGRRSEGLHGPFVCRPGGGPAAAEGRTEQGMRFDEIVSSPPLLRAIAELGWQQPTPIQQLAIPPARTGRDLVGIAQTGTGKTAAFLLPALERQVDKEGLHTLVICPTRELAQQVAEDARALARYTELWVGVIYGGVPMRPQTRDLRAGFDVLVATPGRLPDHLERGNVDLSSVQTLVLDEADRMLDMGFRPQIEQVLRACPPQRQTLLFSATMPHGVHALALRILRDPEWVSITPRTTVADRVDQALYPVRPDRK